MCICACKTSHYAMSVRKARWRVDHELLVVTHIGHMTARH